jgi:hypothetical protein
MSSLEYLALLAALACLFSSVFALLSFATTSLALACACSTFLCSSSIFFLEDSLVVSHNLTPKWQSSCPQARCSSIVAWLVTIEPLLLGELHFLLHLVELTFFGHQRWM